MSLESNKKLNFWLLWALVFLLGTVLSFTISLGLFNWSIPAFLALGASLPFGFLIVPGILIGGGLLRYY